tara:strand:+ start:955 stop:1158 length:204 start_codon:yes stop_codon:yes gene_type:complete
MNDNVIPFETFLKRKAERDNEKRGERFEDTMLHEIDVTDYDYGFMMEPGEYDIVITTDGPPVIDPQD